MNRHALLVLQYFEALDTVAQFAAGPLGAEAVRGLEPSASGAVVEGELRRVEQMMNFLLRSDWSAPAAPDVRPALRRLGVEGSVLDAPDLAGLGALLGAAAQARRAILPHGEDFPLLAELAAGLETLEAEARAIGAAVDDGGEVRDDASPELSRLRRSIRDARSRIVDRLERYVAGLPERVRVPDASVSLREGRYVIQVRRDGRAEVPGIVHDESATGHTLFVEPQIAIDLMNQIRELELAEAREVLRILRSLTGRLRPHLDALASTLDGLVALDALFARARYALRHDGRRPEVVPPGAREYRVVRGFHPLLLAGAAPVVPFDLTLEGEERTLLVSGPNTGGKTVLLKAIGLISAMAQAGIIPPVGDGTRLPLFRDVFADIGDEQSIAASLSTFSAHLKNLLEILERADDSALVLIDEIGSGTDPLEGGALARSILRELTRRGCLTVATSHLGELKRLAGEAPGVVNASLQFDAAALRPTYRLKKGIPGRSYGLAIARRLGFPASLLEESEAELPGEERDTARILTELEEKERRLTAALDEAEGARAAVAELRRELEARESRWRARERELERAARAEARRILLEARAEVESAIRELRAVAAGSAEQVEAGAREARRRIERAARREGARAAEVAPSDEPAIAGAVASGARVRIEATGAVGTVTEVRDGRATVEADGLRLVVPVAGLRELAEAEATAAPRRQGGWTAPEVEASPEVDLRGLRGEEVAGRLDPALDAAVRADLATLRIIHGKGTGALREVVADLLRGDPRVRSQRPGGPGEGGSGVTIAELA